MVYLLVGLFVVVIAILVVASLPGSAHRTAEEVAQYIDNALEGTDGAWDWDTFTSVRIAEPELEAIRLRCIQIQDEFPPTKDGELCSSEGVSALRSIGQQLRDPVNDPDGS